MANGVEIGPAMKERSLARAMRAVGFGIERLDDILVADFDQHRLDLLVLDAQIGGDDARVALHEGRIAIGNLAAIFQHHDVVGNLHDDRHVMLDQQDRRASPNS